MRKTKYVALGKTSRLNISGFPEFQSEYKKAIDEINERKNEQRIQEIATIEGESFETVIAKLEADKDYRLEKCK